ncbi:MAG: ethylbenzene dehydrogenase-related protein [Bacteroidota bacterium]
MTKPNRNYWISFIFLSIVGVTLYFGGCTHDDQDLDEFIPPDGVTINDKELISKKVTAPPSVDGVIDALWDDASPLVITATVPDPGQNVFRGYVGNTNRMTMRSLYDNENLYILAEWSDNSLSQNRETWYFDAAAKRWKQENRYPTFNANGQMTRPAFYEDKLAMLWNVNNSVAGWNNATCNISCHKDLSAAEGLARHYTNAASERIDMWHWKSIREGVWGIVDDQYQDNTTPNGRKSDPKISGSYSDNVQELTITGSTDKVKVPKYFIPGKTNYYWITKDEIDNGAAKLITGVDADGVLVYEGGSLDPGADVDFMRDGVTTGSKCIPSIYTEKVTGNRGDITGKFTYTMLYILYPGKIG